MKFSKYNQPHTYAGGRRPSASAINKKVSAEAEHQRDLQSYTVFEKAESGYFNGYAMTETFHRQHSKENALEILIANDSADVITSAGAKIHAGTDGAVVYIMTDSAKNGNAQKFVQFNHSVYVF